jgi:hypothetical protein
MNRIAIFIAMLIFASVSAYSQALSGDYYIPQGTNPQGFASLAAAITSLNTNGASGTVNFLIDASISETATSLVITRSDLTAANNVVIKPAAGKTPTITIAGATATAGASQYTGITLNGASYVTIDGSNDGTSTQDLSIKMNDGTNGRYAMQFYGNCDNVTVKNCKITWQTMPTANTTTGIYANGQATGACDNLMISNNDFTTTTASPYYSIRITGSSGSSIYCTNVVIANNICVGIIRPIYFFVVGSTGNTSEIYGNQITSGSTSATGFVSYGILMNQYGGTINIYKNKIVTLKTNNQTAQGLFGISTLTAQAGNIVNIYNNVIADFQCLFATTNTTPVAGIYFQDAITANVYHNSININPVNNTTGNVAGVRVGAIAATVTMKNNIISNTYNTATSYGIYYAGTGTLTSDYNDLYISGASAFTGYFGAANQQTLANWTTASSVDANSIGSNPSFTSATNLALLNTSPARDAGTNVGITTDISGNPRALPYDIGAYEYQTTTISSDGNISGTYGDLTINADVTLNGDLSATVLSIASGKSLTVGAYTLTVSNPISGTGTLIADGTSTIAFAGTASGIALPVNVMELNNLTVSNTSGVTLNDVLTVNGTLTLTGGMLTTNGYLTMASGSTISRSAGTLSSAPTYAGTINLQYTGSSSVAADVEYSGISGTTNGTMLNDLTINLSSGTFTTAYGRRINGTLTLASGVHGSGSNIYMAPGTTISRSSGSISAALPDSVTDTYNTSINLIYSGSSSITTGYEFHSSIGLNNLTNTSSGTFTLGVSDSINGNLTHSNGTIAVGANQLGIGGNFTANSGVVSASSSNGRFVCTGTGKTFTLAGTTVARITANITQTPAATNAFDYQVNGFTTYNLASTSYVSFRNPSTSVYTLNIGAPADGSAYGNIELLSNNAGTGSLIFDFVSDVNIAGFLAFPVITSATPTYTVNFNTHTIKIGGAITLNGVNTNTQSPTRVYSYGTSTIELNGTSAQSGLGGTNLPASFYNLTINNSAGATLSGGTTVINTLTFTSGNLSTAANTLTLGALGSVSGEAAGKYVVGNLTTTKTVGTGASTLGGIGVALDAGGADDLGDVTVTRVSGTAGAVTSGGGTGINRNWTITSTNPPASGRTLTLSWNSSDDNGKDLTTAKLFKSTDGGTIWAAAGNAVDVSATRSINVSTTSFSKWTVGDVTNALPVELVSFTVKKQGYGAKVEWKTANEINNHGFDIERKFIGQTVQSANDAVVSSEQAAWAKVGYTEGAGTSSAPKEYSYIDKNMIGGKYQYRLKMTDLDGSFKYSAAVEVTVDGMPRVFSLSQNYPNPFNPTTTIEFSVAATELTSIKLYDITGREVQTLFNDVAQPGQIYSVKVNGSSLASGTYFYVMSSKNYRSVKKLSLIK